MGSLTDNMWQPHRLHRIEAVRPTSSGIVIATTDKGRAYIKPLGGSNSGPHPLACELVGTWLARWFGLPTLEFGLMDLDELDAEMIRHAGGRAEPGPAFATRAIDKATPWSGSRKEIEKAENADIIPRLVVFDTWTRNWDRCPPPGDNRTANYDNLLLVKSSRSKGGHRLIPIDHGECFSVGQQLTARIAAIEHVKDDRVYGLFPAFGQLMQQDLIAQAADTLRRVQADTVEAMVDTIPSRWQVTDRGRRTLVALIVDRAAYLAETVVEALRFASGKLFEEEE